MNKGSETFGFKRFGTLKDCSKKTICWRCKQDICPGEIRYYDNGENKKARAHGPVCLPCRQVLEPGFVPGEDMRTDLEILLGEVNQLHQIQCDVIQQLSKDMAETRRHANDAVKTVTNTVEVLQSNMELMNEKLDRLLSRGSRSAFEVEQDLKAARNGVQS